MAPMGFVKGGTTSSREDARAAAAHADAERRRAAEDSRFRAAREHSPFDLKQLNDTKTSAKLRQIDLGSSGSHAQVVLGLKHKKDNLIQDWIQCEISPQGDNDLALIVCCPRCTLRLGRHAAEAQMTIRQSNRMFWFDQRTRSERAPNALLGYCAGDVWVNPADPNEVYTVAGMVTTQDWITCPQLGCGWRFRIDDSVVHSE